MKIYITFGQCHRHTVNGIYFDHNTVASIECGTHSEGRDIAFSIFGEKFCTSYENEIFESLNYYPNGIVEVPLKGITQ
jgi:hypothetical protein